MNRRKLDFALAHIARNTDTRMQATAMVRRELERDMIKQLVDGVWYTTPHHTRAWYLQRPDGVVLRLFEEEKAA